MALPLHDRVEDPDGVVVERLTLVGDSVQDRPVEGLIEVDRPTVSVNPFRPVNAIVELAEAPARTVLLVGLVEIVKLAVGLGVEGPNLQLSPCTVVRFAPPKRTT